MLAPTMPAPQMTTLHAPGQGPIQGQVTLVPSAVHTPGPAEASACPHLFGSVGCCSLNAMATNFRRLPDGALMALCRWVCKKVEPCWTFRAWQPDRQGANVCIEGVSGVVLDTSDWPLPRSVTSLRLRNQEPEAFTDFRCGNLIFNSENGATMGRTKTDDEDQRERG